MALPSAWRRVLVAGLVLALCSVALPASARPSAGPSVAVIVQGADAGAAARAVERVGGHVVRRLASVDGVAARLPADAAARLDRLGLVVSPDAPARLSSSSFAPAGAEPQVGAARPGPLWGPDAGDGVGVALVDTGVADVPSLAGRVVHGPDLSGEGDGIDRYGHGTFMAGLIAGQGTGLAPGSHVVSVKVAGRDGATTMSALIAAIEWVVAHADETGVGVLSLSFGVEVPVAWRADPLSWAVEQAWASGITVVAAAGNEGQGTVTSPGRDPWVLTVGATDPRGTVGIEDDTVPAWSGSGRAGPVLKPEVVAPGVAVVSARVPGSALDEAYPAARVDAEWFRGSGTSMSTALTAGAAAVLLWAHPEATPDDVKGAVVTTADAVQGGRALDLGGALAADAADWDQELPVAGEDGNESKLVRMPWSDPESSGTRWSGTRWSGTRWSGTRWSGTQWSGTRWSGTRWSGTQWSGTRWSGTRWSGTQWSGTRWSGTRWSGTRWSGTRWSGTRWSGTRWSAADWDVPVS